MTTQKEPIAIIGMGCHLADGILSPDDLWNCLMNGWDITGEVPQARWAGYAARSREHAKALCGAASRGSFLRDITAFDSGFFGIPPREAQLIDPQHRLAMEVAWEALEHAGIPVCSLAGSDTGVFVGIGSSDYGGRLLEDLPRIEPWTAIGASPCGAANRISHALDLRGPSIAVDTACSSSLVALYQAAQSLWLGEIPLALAGGVMVMAAPGLSITLQAAGAISPDGRSKPFDAAADGYGRGEGCAFVVLKRLSDANRDGDRVLAILRGGAIRQDGRTEGIMAPSAAAQRHLIHAACRAAGVTAQSVDYVEAHGTGTRVGDPVEASSLGAVLGAGRPAGQPCLIGSVKSSIGHLEAAAGVTGVIKTLLAITRGVIPPTRVHAGPHPGIPWQELGLALVTEPTPWPVTAHPRRAGVASYGYGGTVAHLILEAAPSAGHRNSAPDQVIDRHEGPRLYPLSGATADGARANAARLADWLLAHPRTPLRDVGHTLARRRSQLPVRATVVADGITELVSALQSVQPGPVISTERHPVWVFSGHGAQWSGMGCGLLTGQGEAATAFTDVIDALGPVYRAELGTSTRDLLESGTFQHVEQAQAAAFAAQVGLAAAWRAHGVHPAAIIGHSVGEIAAAVTAGVLDLTDGARLACRRASLLRRVAGRGAMALVPVPFDEVTDALRDDDEVSAAISASPHATVISGTPVAVERAAKRWRDLGMTVRAVASDVAFHSPQMDSLCAELAEAARGLPVHPPAVPLYSTAVTDPRYPGPRDSGYWVANLREPVRFAAAIAAADEDGYRTFLEVSTHPVVAHSIEETVPEAAVAHSLRRDRPEMRVFLENLGALHRLGIAIDLSALHPGGVLVDLPTMAWQRRRHWVDEPLPATPLGHDPAGHTLLGERPFIVAGPRRARVWQTIIDSERRPYPSEHVVLGSDIVPAAVLLTTFLAAAEGYALRDVSFLVPIPTAPTRALQVISTEDESRIASEFDGEWLTHASASADPAGALASTLVTAPAGTVVDPDSPVSQLAELGVSSMGFPWRVTELRRGPGTLIASVEITGAGGEPGSWAPALDAALTIASVAFEGSASLRMPAHITRLALAEQPPRHAVVRIRVSGPQQVDIDIVADATVVGTLRGLGYGIPDGDPAQVNPAGLLYGVAWRPLIDVAARSVRLAVHGEDGELRALLAAAGVLTDLPGAEALIVAPRPAAGESVDRAAVRLCDELRQAADQAGPLRLWCLTRGALAAADDAALAQTALWGLGRIITAEYPQRWGGVVDLPATPSHIDVTTLLRVLGGRYDEDVVAVVEGQALTSRLVPIPGRAGGGPRCRPESSYLITGGTGALGVRVAQWLASRGARRLVLLSRRAVPPRADGDLRQAIEAAGATVRVVSADVGDRAALARALEPVLVDLPPVRGVVHAAGVVCNQFVRDLDEASLRATLHPKVAGAMALHELFPVGSLDFFVLFSSAGQLLHLPGQGAYAAGNAVLDGLARRRRAAGEPGAVALAWTSWRGLGMSTSSAVVDAELAAHGTASLTAAQALGAWGRLDDQAPANLAVLRVLPGASTTPVLRELTGPAPARPHQAADWTRLTSPRRYEFVLGQVHAAASTVLGAESADVDPARPLVELGLDSLLSVALRRELAQRLGVPLPATLLWHHPSVAAIAAYLCTDQERSAEEDIDEQ